MSEMRTEFNLSKLRGRIVEVFGTQEKLAEHMGRSRLWVNQRLNGGVSMSQQDIYDMSEALGIAPEDLHLYFFAK